MSDIIKAAKESATQPTEGNVASRVLPWLQQHIRENKLGVGDALPSELEIAGQVGVGRSSVREALTALKVLGIIQSQRKGGIRIVRDPVLLELRSYFSNSFETRGQYRDALEFRAALEWGLGSLMLNRANKRTIRALRSEIETVAHATPDWALIHEAEVRFHSALAASCGNRLATLFAHLYGPLFESKLKRGPTPDYVESWVEQHEHLVDTLEAGDEKRFLEALKAHTQEYMRFRKKGR